MVTVKVDMMFDEMTSSLFTISPTSKLSLSYGGAGTICNGIVPRTPMSAEHNIASKCFPNSVICIVVLNEAFYDYSIQQLIAFRYPVQTLIQPLTQGATTPVQCKKPPAWPVSYNLVASSSISPFDFQSILLGKRHLDYPVFAELDSLSTAHARLSPWLVDSNINYPNQPLRIAPGTVLQRFQQTSARCAKADYILRSNFERFAFEDSNFASRSGYA
jgi:hypothetical protein